MYINSDNTTPKAVDQTFAVVFFALRYVRVADTSVPPKINPNIRAFASI